MRDSGKTPEDKIRKWLKDVGRGKFRATDDQIEQKRRLLERMEKERAEVYKECVMLYRPHRGLLEAAMAEVCEVNSLDDIWDKHKLTMLGITKDLKISPYGYDKRIDWDTYIVECVGYGVLGFTNGSIPEHSKEGVMEKERENE